jgi:hypothetical protein
MAGHRHARDMPRRDDIRSERMRQRYESEADPIMRLGWAYDWLRFELGHLGRARLGEHVRDGRQRADALAVEFAAELAARAQEVKARSDAK